MLSISLFVGIVSEDASAAEAVEGYPHLEVEYTVNPESISSIDDEVVVTLRIKGIGGKVEDLPPDILEEMPRKPLDVVLVLDKSGSMESTDYPPDRITAAKEAAKIFVSQIKEDDRVAVVSFSSSTSTVVSFTSDKDSAKSKIGGISTGGGTAVGEGIITALDVLEKGREESVKAIVLLSDGANNRGTSPKTAANRAKGRGSPIYTVGIGTVGGGKDPLDEQTLKEIASITGGEYLYAPDEAELKRVYEILSTKVLNVAGLDVGVDVAPTAFFNVLKREPSSFEFDVIPPDTEKTIRITGKLAIKASAKRIPIVQRFTVTYTDLITGKRKTIIKGPIYVVFSGEIEPSDVKIKNIEFKRKEESYRNVVSADGSHKDATVYQLSDDVKVEIEIKNHEEVTVESVALIYEGKTGKGSTDSKKTDKDSVIHIFDNGGVVGKDAFSDSLFYPKDTLADKESTTVYVVFDEEDDVDDEWHEGTKAFRRSWQVTLNPRSVDIIKFSTSLCSGVSSKNKAAEEILHKIYKKIEYLHTEGNYYWDSDFTILDLNGQNSRGGTTGKPVGVCVDYAAAYISCLRSINIPARGIEIYWDKSQTKEKKGGGHAFSEVYYDDAWRHYDPTWKNFLSPDVYLLNSRGFEDIKCLVEYEPGKLKEDKLTTIKYAVGIIDPELPNLNKPIIIDLGRGKSTAKQKITFTNRAINCIAEDFDISVVDSRELETEITSLSGDDILDINENDHCILKIKVPEDYAKTIEKGCLKIVPIKLKVDYETTDGEEIVKDYTIIVWVER
jgi:Mg-chelatase subunit ChlD